MKRNDWALIISVFLYSWLFYKQFAGLNFLIFDTAVVALLIYRDKDLLKNMTWLSVAAGTLISAFFIFMYSSPLAIIANIFSLAILSALSIDPRTSFLSSVFVTMCSAGSSVVFMFLDWVERKSKKVEGIYKRPFYVKLFLILIPFLIALVFFFFYQTANPLFYDLTKDINLDWISIGWLFFTFSGLLLMYGFYNNNKLKFLVNIDKNASLELSPEIASRKNFMNGLMRLDTENLSGLILFGMLNILLLTVNVLDVNYLWFDGKLPEGIKHKEFVHDGVGTLITSIIVAILIILFYFRGELNYYQKNKWIRGMAYLWIAQNAFMLFSTAYRNDMYIEESGLSYKKIGVYVYLLLTMVGLITTFIKVWKLRTNWYLFRVNAAVYFYVLVISCTFNWDVIITDFNIKKFTDEKKDLEKYLLVDLSFKNLPQLMTLPDSVASKDDLKARDYYYSLRGVYFADFKSGLHTKLYEFMSDMQDVEWQSMCMEKKRVYQEVFMLRETVTEIRLNNFYRKSLKPLQAFDNLRKLDLNGSQGADLNELKMFPKLEKLAMNGGNLDTIKGLPALVNLRELDLSNNSLSDISELRNVRNVEVLDLSGYNTVRNYSPLLALRNLKRLKIGTITQGGLDSLRRTFPNVEISATVYN